VHHATLGEEAVVQTIKVLEVLTPAASCILTVYTNVAAAGGLLVR
jgi:hypothetical protein